METAEIVFEVISEKSENHQQTDIRPKQIKVSKTDTVGFFGKYEIEHAAGRLVRFFQSKNCWCPFTIEDLYLFYKENNLPFEDIFTGLCGYWVDGALQFMTGTPWEEAYPFVVTNGEGKFCITDLFIERCLKK